MQLLLHPVRHHQGQVDSLEVACVVGDQHGVHGDGVAAMSMSISPMGFPVRVNS